MIQHDLLLASTVILITSAPFCDGFVGSADARLAGGIEHIGGRLSDGARQHANQSRRRVFFGELHLHTTMSFDAWTLGTKVTPDQAYKFGKGEAIMIPAVQVAREGGIDPRKDVPARRSWPLDFMAVTDHSENIGTLAQLDDPDSALAKTELGKIILSSPTLIQSYKVIHRIIRTRIAPVFYDAAVESRAWDSEIKAANDNYQPGTFTTFIAYEWGSMPNEKNLHRNVIFNSDHAPVPFSADDSLKPEDLWSYLEMARKSGIDVIAIPHNGNASGGLMYDWNDSDGRPIDEPYAQRRALNEPLTEIVQTKGQSDTQPILSPNDEFANFEVYDHLLGQTIKSEPHGSYIREAYGRGLVIQSRVGVNPFKYGVVGGSDIHTGLSISDESAVAFGSLQDARETAKPASAKSETSPEQLGNLVASQLRAAERLSSKSSLEMGSAGLTGVWAEENTRDSIFAALKRKETFATTGTRIRLRMFAGWNFSLALLKRKDWVTIAYTSGAAMGSDLTVRPKSAGAPGFLIQAMKDPTGANLDRIQMIKVYLDGDSYRERVFDVALSDARRADIATGKARSVGDTVNLTTGSVSDSIDATALTTFWRDPEFDVLKPAVYYLRVLEIPTPRWSTLLAIKSHLPLPNARPATIQERGWSSPIWYTPPTR